MRNIEGSLECEHDTEEGEVFDLEIKYSYVPYVPARITRDPYDSEPADGGYCEDIIFKVIGYRQYDEDGNTTLNLELRKLTPEQTKELTAKFEKLLESNNRLDGYFHELCMKDVEGWEDREPDYD